MCMAVKVHNKYFTHMIQSPRTKSASSYETRQLFAQNQPPRTKLATCFARSQPPRMKLAICSAQKQPPRTKPVVPLHSHCKSCIITHVGEFITSQVGYGGLRVAERSRILRGDGSTQLVVAIIYFTNPSAYAIHDSVCVTR